MAKGKRRAIDEESGEAIEDLDINTAMFFISDGKQQLRVKAENDCWSISKQVSRTDKDTKEVTQEWIGFKWVVDIGMVAGRFFEWRLKNSEAKTLQELSDMAKQIRLDIRKEFTL